METRSSTFPPTFIDIDELYETNVIAVPQIQSSTSLSKPIRAAESIRGSPHTKVPQLTQFGIVKPPFSTLNVIAQLMTML